MAMNVRKARKEFAFMIDRCGCSQAHMYGRCHPSRCFPALYEGLYSGGGFHRISSVARKTRQIKRCCRTCGFGDVRTGDCFSDGGITNMNSDIDKVLSKAECGKWIRK